MNATSLAIAIKAEAQRLGFTGCHICTVTRAPHADFFTGWLERGNAGEMTYLLRNAQRRCEPGLLAAAGEPPFRSLLVLTVDYHHFALPAALANDPARGQIARYGWGDDYHELIRPLLFALDGFIRRQTGRQTLGKCLVDSGPVLERDWAQAAGAGFTGKNCCTIRPGVGSWFLLATLLIPELLPPDPAPQAPAPQEQTARTVGAREVLQGLPPGGAFGAWRLADGEAPAVSSAGAPSLATCGRCTRCLDSCPTAAFVGPYHLEPRRCIAYWTIEASGPIPRELRPRFGNWIFGCDRCQEVCPYNQRLPARQPRLAGLAAQTDRIAPRLLDGFDPAHPYWIDDEAFRRQFRRSPIKRARRTGMLRNVCVALGNWGAPETVAALVVALQDPHPLPRGHAAWALGQVWVRQGDARAQAALLAAQSAETDWLVQEELALAVAGA